jgi:cytochrome c2
MVRRKWFFSVRPPRRGFPAGTGSLAPKLAGAVLALGAPLVLLPARAAVAVELPAPETLAGQPGLAAQVVEVIEPHLSEHGHEQRVAYRGIPMEPLLNRQFGARWQSPDAEIVFFARDGYRSAIAGERFGKARAYLAYARADGRPFVVDNPRQHEAAVPLGPYYLVWDNRNDAALRTSAEYGWPYQVERMEMGSASDYRSLQPAKADAETRRGFEYFKDYCLTCHQVGNIGGRKFPADLARHTCGWTDPALKRWIMNPGATRPDTTMPPLNVNLPETERGRIADAILAYLGAFRTEHTVCGG